MTDSSTSALRARINAIEGSYELFLGYAAKGSRGGPGSGDGSVRTAIEQMDRSLEGLGEFLAATVRERGLEPLAAYDGFITVLSQDALQSRAALQLVAAQETISSAVFDNLNGSIHLRAILTDLFLIDEILRPRASEGIPAAALANEKPPPPDKTS